MMERIQVYLFLIITGNNIVKSFTCPQYEYNYGGLDLVLYLNQQIIYGYWFKYQPLLNSQNTFAADLQSQIISYQLNTVATIEMVHYLQLDVLNSKIMNLIQIETESRTYVELQFEFDQKSYEGTWLFFNIYFDFQQAFMTISIISEFKNKVQHKIYENPRYIRQMAITGYIEVGAYNSPFLTSEFAIFTGQISQILYKYSQITPEEIIEQCPISIKCTVQDIIIISGEKKFKGDEWLSFNTGKTDKDNYILYGWIKCTPIAQLSDRNSVALRLSVSNEYTDDLKIGDRVFYMVYHQSQFSQSDGINIATYSYQFPSIYSYNTQTDDAIMIMSQHLTQWHQFQFFFSYDFTSQKPYFALFFPNIDLEPKKYFWSKNLYHLSGADYALSVGGDKYANNYFIGSISNLKFQNCAPIQLLWMLNCHSSCKQCSGPTEKNCRECPEGRNLNQAQGSCQCPSGTNEPNCQKLSEIYPQITQLEKQRAKNLNQCQFGYFQYESTCIKWYQLYFYTSPQQFNSKNIIYCADCILNQYTWQHNPLCTFDYETYDQNEGNIYQLIQRQESQFNFYKIENNQLVLCYGCYSSSLCLQGYYFSELLESCQRCSQGCEICLKADICSQCQLTYTLNNKQQCEQCENCSDCMLIDNEQYCFECIIGYQPVDWTCTSCPINCSSCGNEQCYYCADSGYFVSYNGIDCEQCAISHCQYCFYYLQEYTFINTINVYISYNYYSLTYGSNTLMIGCALCDDGYQVDLQTGSCILVLNEIIGCSEQILNYQNENICLVGTKESGAIQQSNCQIVKCLSCINNYKGNVDYCIICDEGYYASALTGKCNQCPYQCSSCVQYNKQYKDTWKWNIRAFYDYFLDQGQVNKLFFEYATSTSESDYSILCKSCVSGLILHNNSCLEGCASNCNLCEIINDIPTCIECEGSLSGPLKSEINGACIKCPTDCTFCVPRTSEYNPFYQSTDEYSYYFIESRNYLDSDGLVTQCNDSLECFQSIYIKYNVYCSLDDFEVDKLKSGDPLSFIKENMIFSQLFDWQFEEEYLYTVLNENSIREAEIQINIKMGSNQQCVVPVSGNIQSKLMNNVFSLNYITLNIFSYDQAIILIQNMLFISNFTELQLTDVRFVFDKEESNIIIKNSYQLMKVQFANIQFETIPLLKTSNFQIIIEQSQNIYLKNLKFTNFNPYNSIPIFAINQEQNNNIILVVENLIITNCTFNRSSLFTFQNVNHQIQIQNITIQNSKFDHSSLISSSGTFTYSLRNIAVIDCSLIQNLFIESNVFSTISTFKISLINLENITFEKNSHFIVFSMLEMDNLFVQNITMDSGTLLINQEFQLLDAIEIVLLNSEFNNVRYQNNGTILKVKQLQTLILVNISQLTFNNVFIGGIGTGELAYSLVSYLQSTIYIESQLCFLNDIAIQRGHGLPEFSLIISNFLQIQGMKVNMLDIYQVRPLHQNFECIKQYLYLNQYFVIYFGNYSKIIIDDLRIENCMAFNYPLLLFNSKDKYSVIQEESIIISNSIFKLNVLLVTEFNYQASILSIKSGQSLNLYLKNLSFIGNHLHQYADDQNEKSSPTIAIISQKAIVNLQNLYFFKNLVTNSTNSIVYIISKELHIFDCQFIENNIMNYELIKKNLFFPNISNIGIEQIFTIKSASGIGILNSQIIKIDNILVNQAFGVDCGGFMISLIKNGGISIFNSIIQQINSDLALFTNPSQSGFLLIDASQSRLDLVITNISIKQCFSRLGSAIYILPSASYNQVKLYQVSLQDIYSIDYGFINMDNSKTLSSISQILIIHLILHNNNTVYDQFFSQISDIQDSEIEKIRTNNPLINSRFNNFTVQNMEIYNVINSFILNIDQSQSVKLENILLSNLKILYSNIIRIVPSISKDSSIQIANVTLELIDQIEIPILQNIDCNYIDGSNIYEMQCGNDNNLQIQVNNDPILDTFTNDQQLDCNLQKIYENQNIDLSLILIKEVYYYHQFTAYDILIYNVNCSLCTLGIFTIQNSVNIHQSQSISINKLKFINNTCGTLGCLTLIFNPQITGKFQGQNSARLLQIDSYQNFSLLGSFQIKIDDSLFIRNIAKYGGAIFIQEASVLFMNCIMFNNTATESGGAIYFLSENQNIFMYFTQFIENQALLGAQLYLENYQMLPFKQSNFIVNDNNNKSQIYETPTRLIISLDLEKTFLYKSQITNEENILIEEISYSQENSEPMILMFATGQTINSFQYFNLSEMAYIPQNQSLRIIALNQENTQISNLNNSKCILSSQLFNSMTTEIIKSDYDNLSFKEVYFYEKDYNLDNLTIFFNPYSDDSIVLQIYVECDSVKIPNFSGEVPFLVSSYVQKYQLKFNVRTYKCQVGEYYISTTGTCKLCNIEENQYSVKTNIINCKTKNDQTMSQIKPGMIELRQGFWRPTLENDQIEKCYNLESNCLGGWGSGNSICKKGHFGALCEQCDLYNVRGDGSFSQSGTYNCGPCKLLGNIVLQIFLLCFYMIGSIMVSVQSTHYIIDNFILSQFFRIQRGFPIYISECMYYIYLVNSAILIKVFTNYLQIVGAISTFSLQIPSVITSIVNTMSNPIEQMSNSLDCFLIDLTNIDIVYFRTIWGFLMSFLYMMTFLLLYLILLLIKYYKYKFSYISTAILYLYIYLQPNFVSSLMHIISYRHISDIYWIQGNLGARYATTTHLYWILGFTTPFLLIIGFIIPIYLISIIHQNKKNWNKIQFRKTWGYLYNEYHPSTYYWEIIKINSKQLIIFFMAFYQDFVVIKAVLGFLVLYFYNSLTFKHKPYLSGILNRIDQKSTAYCALTYVLAVAIYSAQQQDFIEIVIPFYIIIAIINLEFISNVIMQIIFAYSKKLQQYVDRCKLFLIKYFPNLQNYKKMRSILETAENRKLRIMKRFEQIKKYLLMTVRQGQKKLQFTTLLGGDLK